MQENKKKKSSGMWMFLLILVLAIGYFVYDTYFKDDTKQNQTIVKSDIEVGTVYEYSEEEIRSFIEYYSNKDNGAYVPYCKAIIDCLEEML